MHTRSPIRSTIAVSVLLFGTRAASAACVISGVRPTVPLPTMADGQEFSFLASADCETLRFRVRGATLTKEPQPGTGMGSKDRTYKVRLTEEEWNSAVEEGDTTFTWSIIGTSSAGAMTRVTTTNELKSAPVTVDLSMADAKLVGEEADDHAGYSVSGAGDVDADGHDDLLVGAYGGRGAAYVVLGPVTGILDLALADAKLVGERIPDNAGRSVSGAGDVDGDGHDDLLIGAPYNHEGGRETGSAYLVLGPVTGTLGLSLADAQLMGENPSDTGLAVSGAGDVDSDGHDDLLVGSQNAAYLVLGPVTGDLVLSRANAKLVGAGPTVAGAGDVDADGHDDLLVGLHVDDEGGGYAGAAYLVLGPVTGTVFLSVPDAKLVGEEPYDYAGASVSGAGDVDGDGHADLLIGANQNGAGGARAGAAYLVLGPVTGTRDLSLADAKLVGEESKDWAGVSVSGAGDVDGNGHDDLLVGAPVSDYVPGAPPGAAYVVLGPVTGTVDLALADAKLVGEENGDRAGSSVSGAGDVDGDGLDDVLVGAAYNDEAGSRAGAAYLVYGASLF